MKRQPVPTISSGDVDRIVGRDFGDAAEEAALLLREAGLESRVAAAAMKLAEGSIDALRATLQLAATDWRDVVGPAEYRRFMQLDKPNERDRVAAIAADWAEYKAWLHG